MHKQYSRLVQVKASKRLGSDQLESVHSHEHALKLINTEYEHEQDIMHHEHKYRRGYVDYVTTTCGNMCQANPLETSKRGNIIAWNNQKLQIRWRRIGRSLVGRFPVSFQPSLVLSGNTAYGSTSINPKVIPYESIIPSYMRYLPVIPSKFVCAKL